MMHLTALDVEGCDVLTHVCNVGIPVITMRSISKKPHELRQKHISVSSFVMMHFSVDPRRFFRMVIES